MIFEAAITLIFKSNGAQINYVTEPAPKLAFLTSEGARLEIIDGAGRMVMIAKPEDFNSKVMDFLEPLGDMRK